MEKIKYEEIKEIIDYFLVSTEKEGNVIYEEDLMAFAREIEAIVLTKTIK